MKSWLGLKIYILLYFPRYIFMSKKEKVFFCLDYLIPNRYAFFYAVCQSSMESGNFANTNTIKRNNPFNLAFGSYLGILAKNDGGWAKFFYISDGVYCYTKWVNNHQSVKHAMIDNAPNNWANNELGSLVGMSASQYFANVSVAMINSNYCTSCTTTSYNQAVFAYYLSTQDSNGVVKVPLDVWAAIVTGKQIGRAHV